MILDIIAGLISDPARLTDQGAVPPHNEHGLVCLKQRGDIFKIVCARDNLRVIKKLPESDIIKWVCSKPADILYRELMEYGAQVPSIANYVSSGAKQTIIYGPVRMTGKWNDIVRFIVKCGEPAMKEMAAFVECRPEFKFSKWYTLDANKEFKFRFEIAGSVVLCVDIAGAVSSQEFEQDFAQIHECTIARSLDIVARLATEHKRQQDWIASRGCGKQYYEDLCGALATIGYKKASAVNIMEEVFEAIHAKNYSIVIRFTNGIAVDMPGAFVYFKSGTSPNTIINTILARLPGYAAVLRSIDKTIE